MVKLFIRIPILLMAVVLVYFNIRLFHTQSYNADLGYDEDVYAQLQHLKMELHQNNAAIKMQQFFPEGFIFINALYALTWCELVDSNTDSTIKKEAIEEVDWAISEILSEYAKSSFNEELPLKYGVFYRGWTNYVIAQRINLGTTSSSLKQLFKQNCDEISEAYEKSESPYLESYYMAAWPADNMLAVASLNLGEQILAGSHSPKSILPIWLEKVKKLLDDDGRIPHGVQWETGKTIEASKGNSMSLMLCFLYDIDSSFAKSQFINYKENFLDERLGLPGIREHAKGLAGDGDIDSGPVIWEIGGAASIVGQRTMATYSEWNVYLGLRNSIEAFGAAYIWNGKKKYVFGQMPMADAFIAWSNVAAKESTIKTTSNWRWKFQLGSAFVLLIFSLLGKISLK